MASITLVSLGFEHPLYNFGDVGFVMVSDLNGADVGGAKSWWLRLYWGGVCLILSVMAYLLWRGRRDLSACANCARSIASCGCSGCTSAVGFAISAVTGSWMFYQMNVVNEYVISDEQEERLAD